MLTGLIMKTGSGSSSTRLVELIREILCQHAQPMKSLRDISCTAVSNLRNEIIGLYHETKKEVIILLLVIVMIFFSGCGTESPEQKAEVPNKDTLSIEARYEIEVTETYQIKQYFSIQNTGLTAASNVMVEAYLLAPDQDVNSPDFKYIDYKLTPLGIINPSGKTNEYSVNLGKVHPGSEYQAYLYVEATSAEGNIGSFKSDVFTIPAYSREGFYQETYCDKIDPYNLDIRKAATEAVKAHAGTMYNFDQALDIYTWIKKKIKHVDTHKALTSAPSPPLETLTAKSGDYKSQAVLIASMIQAIGGVAMVVIQPSCEHVFTIVYAAESSENLKDYVSKISDHYYPCKEGFICGGKCWTYPENIGVWCDGKTAAQSNDCPVGQVGFIDNQCHWCESDQTLILETDEGTAECQDRSGFHVTWFDYQNKKWLIFDPSGGFYPGEDVPACISDVSAKREYIQSCVKPPK